MTACDAGAGPCRAEIDAVTLARDGECLGERSRGRAACRIERGTELRVVERRRRLLQRDAPGRIRVPFQTARVTLAHVRQWACACACDFFAGATPRSTMSA